MFGCHGDGVPNRRGSLTEFQNKRSQQRCRNTHQYARAFPAIWVSLVPKTDFYFPNMFCSKSALSVAIEIQRKRDQYNRFGTWPKSVLTMCEAGIWNHWCISTCLGDKNNSSPLCQGARGTMPRSEGMGATWVCKLAQAIRHGHLIL